MHVNGKRMAFLGLLLALNSFMIILSSVLEFNTLFLLIAAAFTVGIAMRESNIRLGVGFFIASILLWVIIAPNKIYGITYSVLGIYILLREIGWELIDRAKSINHRRVWFLITRLLIFNIIYIPLLIFFPQLLRMGLMVNSTILPFDVMSPVTILIFLLIGQIIFFLFDYVYVYFQGQVWNKIRAKVIS